MLFSLLFGRGRPALDVDALYRQYAGMVVRRVRRFFPDPTEAEEISHEIFLRVVEKQHTFRSEASPTTWLYALTTRFCLNRLRDGKRRAALRTEFGAQPWAGPAMPADGETAAFAQQVWADLDEELAQVGVHYFVDGLSHGEIADLMGVSRRTVGNRVEALRRQVRAAAGLVPVEVG